MIRDGREHVMSLLPFGFRLFLNTKDCAIFFIVEGGGVGGGGGGGEREIIIT